jgi:hypothetical protein
MYIFSAGNTTRAFATLNIGGPMGYEFVYTLADYGSSPSVWATEVQALGGAVLSALANNRAPPFPPTNCTFYVYVPANVSAVQLSFRSHQVCAFAKV